MFICKSPNIRSTITNKINRFQVLPAVHGGDWLQVINLQGLEVLETLEAGIGAGLGVEPVTVGRQLGLQLVEGRKAAEDVLGLRSGVGRTLGDGLHDGGRVGNRVDQAIVCCFSLDARSFRIVLG